MNKIRRTAGIILTSLSAAACVAACCLWAVSLFQNDTIGWCGWRNQPAGIWHGWAAQSVRHEVMLAWFAGTFRIQNPRSVAADDSMIPAGFFHEWNRPSERLGNGSRGPLWWAGFDFHSVSTLNVSPKSITIHFLILPWWFLILLPAIPPAFAVRAYRRRRKHPRPGYCPRCNYDLRASPHRCPECGAAAPV